MGHFLSGLFDGTLHVDKIYVQFKIANITHALPIPVEFTPKTVVVTRLHDTVVRFRTGVKFSPRYNNQGELMPGWLAPAWHFVVVSCIKQMQSHERKLEWSCASAKVTLVPCKHLLTLLKHISNCHRARVLPAIARNLVGYFKVTWHIIIYNSEWANGDYMYRAVFTWLS